MNEASQTIFGGGAGGVSGTAGTSGTGGTAGTSGTSGTGGAPGANASAPEADSFTQAMIRDMRASGKFADDTAIRGALAADGFDVSALPAGLLNIAPNEEAREIEVAFPAAQAHEFTLPLDGLDSREAAQIHSVATRWLTAGGFSKENGSIAAREVDSAAIVCQHMSDVDRAVYARTERAKLASIWRERTDENIKLAQTFVAAIEEKAPGLMALLDETGAGNSAAVIIAVHRQAEIARMKARAAKRKA